VSHFATTFFIDSTARLVSYEGHPSLGGIALGPGSLRVLQITCGASGADPVACYRSHVPGGERIGGARLVSCLSLGGGRERSHRRRMSPAAARQHSARRSGRSALRWIVVSRGRVHRRHDNHVDVRDRRG